MDSKYRLFKKGQTVVDLARPLTLSSAHNTNIN